MMKKKLIRLTSLLLIILVASCVKLPVLPPLPPEPDIEDSTPTEEFINEITLTVEQLVEQGGADPAVIEAAHNLQSRYELIYKRLEESKDEKEILLGIDLLQAILLEYIDSLKELEEQDRLGAAIVRESAEKALQELASVKKKVDAALVEFVVALGEPQDEIRDVAVVIPLELLTSIASEMEMSPEHLEELLDRIPLSERLTVVDTGEGIIVDPSGNRYKVEIGFWDWVKRVWDKVKGWVKRSAMRALLVAKLAHLALEYLPAIIDCYYHHFPDWAAVDRCLVEKHGLAKDVVTRILRAIQDP